MTSEIRKEMEKFEYIWNAELELYDGPYDPGKAAEAAHEYNQFVLEDVFKWMGVQAVGPWYPVKWERVPAPHQLRLAYKYAG